MKKQTLSSLVLASLFATLSIVLTQFLSFYIPFLGNNSVRIGFGHVPLLLAGLLLGPFWGAATGAVADFVGAVVFPFGGAYFPGFTVTAMLTGLIPALLKRSLGWQRLGWLQILLITLVTETVASIFVNTLWLSLMYGMNYWATLMMRLPVTLCMCVVYSAVNYPLYSRASKELNRFSV
ncbi:folate family ECF transporter S component [Bacilliculturomica massiliensis]|uniref:folate family ECF transporter S component n=1 Tax=Bacilliculturomica massiliensis TaxID=1917867 RepID=UPI00103138AF|nr:folate family ECF transporter S component [Bacilliculturomica massiliensis]